MSVIDDVRKLLQDLIAPDLRAITAKLEAIDTTSKLRDDALAAKIGMFSDSVDSKFQMVLARMDAQHATVMNALAIDKRLEVLERVQQTPHQTT